MSLLKQLCHKLHLHQCLASADRYAALVSPVGTVAQGLVKKLVGSQLLAGAHFPRVRIVAVLATHGTSLHENNEPHARSVYRPESLYTMNVSFCHTNRNFFSVNIE